MKFHFFGGKGGVGKTTLSLEHARGLSRRTRVLLVSTDPAHSLGDALGKKLSSAPRPVSGKRLFAVELDADQALTRWLSKRKKTIALIAERGTYLDREDIDRFLRLSFPGVDELVGLVELLRLSRLHDWDEVVVDTAPQGHTLRLLAMPQTLRRIAQVFGDMQGKHQVVAEALGGRLRRDVADALIEELDREGAELAELLRDPKRTALTWVMLPEALSLEETKAGAAALEREGLQLTNVIVNQVTPAPPGGRCVTCTPRRAEEKKWIS